METEVSEAYVQELMDSKSSAVYEKWFKRYETFASEKNIAMDNVTTFMNWLCSLKDVHKFAASTIISAGSCVNSRIKLLHNKNFMENMLVKDLIKKLHRHHVPKQASVFSMDQIHKFVLNAPETLNFSVKKLIAMIGIQGALRISEICDLHINDVTFMQNGCVTIYALKLQKLILQEEDIRLLSLLIAIRNCVSSRD